MSKSTPLHQLPLGGAHQQQHLMGPPMAAPSYAMPQAPQQAPPSYGAPSAAAPPQVGMPQFAAMPPPQITTLQQQQQQQQQQQAPPPQPAMAAMAPMQQGGGIGPPLQTPDVLDDDATVNDVLKQINDSFLPAGPAGSGQAHLPSLGFDASSNPYGSAPPPLAEMAPQQMSQMLPPAHFVDGSGMAMLPSAVTSGSSIIASVSWMELIRLAVIIAILFVAVHFLPIEQVVTQHIPALLEFGHAVVMVKAVALAGLFVLAVKLPLL